MRLIASIIVLMCVVSSAMANGPIEATVTNASFKILPERGTRAANYADWAATNTYSQGAIVEGSYLAYMAMTTGVSGTTAPAHGFGMAVDTAGGMMWYAIPSGKRSGAVISSVSTNILWLSFGTPAVVDRGPFLVGAGSSISLPDDFQGAVYGISPAAGVTNTVTASEY